MLDKSSLICVEEEHLNSVLPDVRELVILADFVTCYQRDNLTSERVDRTFELDDGCGVIILDSILHQVF
jgi:hypothetical protein